MMNERKKRVVVVDDEPAAIENLRTVLTGFEELEIVAEVGDGHSAIQVITERQPDIVFLDIEMPELNGFDVAAATAHLSYQLVFVTAYDQYALDAFDTNAIDYLVKPVRPSLLEKCIRKILHQEGLALEALERQKSPDNRLVLSDGSATRVLDPSHICFIEGIGRYRRIHLSAAGAKSHRMPTIVSDTTLDEFETQLPAPGFVRLHRSYIVNRTSIVELASVSRRHYVRVAELNIKIPVSRSNVALLKALLA